jgi:hypothetical protein
MRREGGDGMKGELTREVYQLTLIIARELQKNPLAVTSDMLTALRNSAKLMDQNVELSALEDC